MTLRPAFAALLMTMLAASDLAAQPAAKPALPVEDVTVTGARTRQAIEGRELAGLRIVLIEDVITTGGAVADATKLVRAAGGDRPGRADPL